MNIRPHADFPESYGLQSRPSTTLSSVRCQRERLHFHLLVFRRETKHTSFVFWYISLAWVTTWRRQVVETICRCVFWFKDQCWGDGWQEIYYPSNLQWGVSGKNKHDLEDLAVPITRALLPLTGTEAETQCPRYVSWYNPLTMAHTIPSFLKEDPMWNMMAKHLIRSHIHWSLQGDACENVIIRWRKQSGKNQHIFAQF